MNELIDRIMDMPVRQRVLLLVGVVFLIFGGYAYLIYWPRADMITEKEEQVATLLQDRDRKAALVANLPQAKKEVADLNAALKEAVAQRTDRAVQGERRPVGVRESVRADEHLVQGVGELGGHAVLGRPEGGDDVRIADTLQRGRQVVRLVRQAVPADGGVARRQVGEPGPAQPEGGHLPHGQDPVPQVDAAPPGILRPL